MRTSLDGNVKVNMSPTLSYARAVDVCAERAPQTFQAVDMSTWPPTWAARCELSKGSSAATDNSNLDLDLLDCDFIDFHRELQQHMLDRYGLLGRSQAHDLHIAILPCLSVVDGYESETSDTA